jgi:PPK2 family polyphosphate:nucleotide phosphotransferase
VDLTAFRVKPGSQVDLKQYNPADKGSLKTKQEAQGLLQDGIDRLSAYQDVLYAQNIYGILIIFQAMDGAGKDSTIKHVMSGVNPQGCQVFSFKAPSEEERDHDYLWRSVKALPERGRIGIHNRSYYEEVLIARVHPEILESQQLPPKMRQNKQIWQQRFEEINQFERYLTNNGTVVIKFFLNVSKAEQKRRFLKRIDQPEKNWKFSAADVQERRYWEDYQRAYEAVLSQTSTEAAPWYVVPADHKWFTRLTVAEIINDRLSELQLAYPTLDPAQTDALKQARILLESEPDD